MKRVLVFAAIGLAACGGSPSAPSTGGTSGLTAVSGFQITQQQVLLDRNTVGFSWSGGGAGTYKLTIGTAIGLSDALSTDVSGGSFTWNGPRTAGIYYARVVATDAGQSGPASPDLPVFTLDLRNAIDALFFGQGPMSDGLQPASVSAIWQDGATISVLVTEESGAVSLQAAQAFIADYLATTNNFVTVTIGTTPTAYSGVSLFDIPVNTVIVRIDKTICPQAGVIACAYYGPLPYGSGRSFVNLNLAPTASLVGGSVAVSHEIGHSFGLHHIVMNSSGRPEFQFLMNPALVTSSLSVVEKNAIAAARAGGMRAGWTRAQAISAGLVLGSGAAAFKSLIPGNLRDALLPGR